MPREKQILTLILALFILMGFTYALITPAFEASDELWHYPMVRHLADGNPLPVQVFDPAQAGPWNQEASQPPLYYYLSAALTFWIDTADMESIRQLNPHVDNGVITPDGNTNLAIHDPASNPWQGTLLAVRLIRLFSVLISAVTVYLTYRIGREAAPDRPEIGLGAAAINAFLPMFLFISGAVNNDNLAVALSSLALLLMIRLVTLNGRGDYRPISWWRWVVLSLVIGAATLTKEGTLGLLPMAAGTAFVATWQWLVRGQDKPPAPALAGAFGRLVAAGLLVLLPVLFVAGWWYYRNIVLYGDWLGWSAFIAVLGQRAHPASLAQLWGERQGFLMSFWGLFGGVNVPMSPWIYSVLNAVLVLSVIGFAVYAIRLLMNEIRLWRESDARLSQRLLMPVERNFALIVCLVFAAAVIFGLIQWATTTWSSQGRLVFTAISALAVLMALGLAGWMPPRPARITLAAVAGFMLVVAVLAPFMWIRPAYAQPVAGPPLANRVDAQFGDSMRLVGYEVSPGTVQPGEGVWVKLEWEVLRPMDRDWSVFVHANDPVLGQPIAQRDMYPGRGLRATHLLAPGDRLTDSIYMTIPQTAVAPAELEIAVGLYDYSTGERLPVNTGGDAVDLGTVSLATPPGDVPNPVQIAFEQGLKLVGFQVEPRRTLAGTTIVARTWWQPAEPLAQDYTFFGQIVGEDTTRYAGSDMMPVVPTSQWEVGKVYELEMDLVTNPQTSPGTYPLIVGVYSLAAPGEFDRLQLVTPDGRLTDDFLVLTPVRID